MGVAAANQRSVRGAEYSGLCDKLNKIKFLFSVGGRENEHRFIFSLSQFAVRPCYPAVRAMSMSCMIPSFSSPWLAMSSMISIDCPWGIPAL